MNELLASVFTPAQTVICIIVAVVGVALIVTNVVLAYIFNKRGERKLYDRLLQQERELLMQQLKNMNAGAGIDKEQVDGLISAVQDSDQYTASEEKTINDLRNVITSAAEKFEVVTGLTASETVAAAAAAVPAPAFAPEPEPEEEPDAFELIADDEEEEPEVIVTESGQILRYNRSFTARVIQGGDELQSRYTELKNHLLSYQRVHSRVSWKRDGFRFGRNTFAAIAVRGKTLCLYLALDPKQFDETKYKVNDLTVRNPKAKLPLLYRIRNDRRVGYAKELIDLLMAQLGAETTADYAEADFRMPYETTDVLIERGQIKIVGAGGTPFAGLSAVSVPAEEPGEETEEDEPEEEAEEIVDFADDEEEEPEVVVTESGQVLRYNRSFTARIIQGGDLLQSRYTELKNHLLSYKRVHSRISWKRDSFRLGRQTVATFVVRGKTLCLCLALDPKQFEGSKYKVKDLSLRSPKSKTPLLYQIRNDRRVGYAKELIDLLMAQLNAEIATNYAEEDFRMPYETTEELIGRELIRIVGEGGAPFAGRSVTEPETEETAANEVVPEEEPVSVEENEIVRKELVIDSKDFVPAEEPMETDPEEELPERDFEIREEVTVNEAEAISDEAAEQLIEEKILKRKKPSDGKKGIINIDSLSSNFNAGSHVTLSVLRDRGLIGKDVNYLKVLAKGTLNKPLIVEADNFSLPAVKMIVLTGGRAILTKSDE